jgi:hypothetical protein
MTRLSIAVVALVTALLASPSVFAGRNGPAPTAGGPPSAPRSTQVQPTPAEATDMLFMREEEKLARDVYVQMHDLWALAPFADIAVAEQHHMDAMLRLLTRYRLPDPAAGMLIGEFVNPELQTLHDTLIEQGAQSYEAALRVGGLIEEADMEDIAAAIARSDKSDIDLVYESLLCGSRNHLRSFARVLEALTGEPYVAQVIAEAAVDAILAAPMERCSHR